MNYNFDKKVIMATVDEKTFSKALSSNGDLIFMLTSDVLTVGEKISLAHKAGKKVFVHIDMAEGIGKDKVGVEYLRARRADGIITTKNNLALASKKVGMAVVQRFFIIDSKSIQTAIDSVHVVRPDMVELMPGVVYKAIDRFSKEVKIPVIAGGLIAIHDEVKNALKYGASAVSTTKTELWNI